MPKREALVFRVEDRKGEGPYNTGLWQTRDHCPETGCPGPTSEQWKAYFGRTKTYGWYGLPCRKTEYQFGFESPESLFDWFEPEEICNLFSKGFKIAVYRCLKLKDVFLSEKQLIFKKDDSVKIAEFGFSEKFFEKFFPLHLFEEMSQEVLRNFIESYGR